VGVVNASVNCNVAVPSGEQGSVVITGQLSSTVNVQSQGMLSVNLNTEGSATLAPALGAGASLLVAGNGTLAFNGVNGSAGATVQFSGQGGGAQVSVSGPAGNATITVDSSGTNGPVRLNVPAGVTFNLSSVPNVTAVGPNSTLFAAGSVALGPLTVNLTINVTASGALHIRQPNTMITGPVSINGLVSIDTTAGASTGAPPAFGPIAECTATGTVQLIVPSFKALSSGMTNTILTFNASATATAGFACGVSIVDASTNSQVMLTNTMMPPAGRRLLACTNSTYTWTASGQLEYSYCDTTGAASAIAPTFLVAIVTFMGVFYST